MNNDRAFAALAALADQIRAVALEGLTYTKDAYDRARYERLLALSTEPVAQGLGLDTDKLIEAFRREVGCITPKLGVDVAVTDGAGRLLVVARADGTGWCLPCGWVDVGESPVIAGLREVREETGLTVLPLGYLAISTKGPGQSQHIQHQANVLILAKTPDVAMPIALSHEHTDWRWIDTGEGLTWHPGHGTQVALAFDFLAGRRTAMLPLD